MLIFTDSQLTVNSLYPLVSYVVKPWICKYFVKVIPIAASQKRYIPVPQTFVNIFSKMCVCVCCVWQIVAFFNIISHQVTKQQFQQCKMEIQFSFWSRKWTSVLFSVFFWGNTVLLTQIRLNRPLLPVPLSGEPAQCHHCPGYITCLGKSMKHPGEAVSPCLQAISYFSNHTLWGSLLCVWSIVSILKSIQ